MTPIKMYLNGIELPELEVALTITPLTNEVDVVTADNNMYTSFAVASRKKLISHRWKYLTDEQFELLQSFYDDQFITYDYPLLSIPAYDIEDMPVKMTLSPQEIIDNCGTVQNVGVSFRESNTNSGGSS